MSSARKMFVRATGILCIITCIGDLLLLYILGNRYPGYDHLKDTISRLGASASPVSDLVSAWWIFIGIAFLIFAIGFYMGYRDKSKTAGVAALLIALYGLGEGIGSGLFKADHINGSLTTSALIHDAVGGIGLTAMLILPLIMRKLFNRQEHKSFCVFSTIVFYTGLLLTFLFMFRYLDNNLLSVYKGLWQRLSLAVFYAYLVSIAVMMIMNLNKKSNVFI